MAAYYNCQPADDITRQQMLSLLEQGVTHGVVGIYENRDIREKISLYLQMADSIYSVMQQLTDGAIEQCEVVLNNGDTLNLKNSGAGIVIMSGEMQVIITQVTLEALINVFVNDALVSPAFYYDTRIGEVAAGLINPEHNDAAALAVAPQNLAPSHAAPASMLSKTDILAKHQQIDALYDRFKVSQSCYLGATYLLQKYKHPDEYILPLLFDRIAVINKQIDSGVLFVHDEKKSKPLPGISAKRYDHNPEYNSLFLMATAAEIASKINILKAEIVEKYKSGCVIKTGGGDGHYNFYDTKDDVFYSGGVEAFKAGTSGVSFENYITNYCKNIDDETDVILTISDRTPSQLVEALKTMMKITGLPEEDMSS